MIEKICSKMYPTSCTNTYRDVITFEVDGLYQLYQVYKSNISSMEYDFAMKEKNLSCISNTTF